MDTAIVLQQQSLIKQYQVNFPAPLALQDPVEKLSRAIYTKPLYGPSSSCVFFILHASF